MILDINTDAVVVFTNKLEKLRRSALPNAIRTALNSAAFNVKQVTMPKSAAQRFTQRTPNFFKANSRVDMAKGWDIKSMQAIVGFTNDHLKIPDTNYAIADLEQQEYSGRIHAKTFIPLKGARINEDENRVVRTKNRLSTILKENQIFSSQFSRIAQKGRSQSPKANFIAAVHAAGPGGLVLGNRKPEILWRVDSIGKDNKFKLTALYSVKSGRSVKVAETGFMRWASIESANKLEDFYIEAAKKQIDRVMFGK